MKDVKIVIFIGGFQLSFLVSKYIPKCKNKVTKTAGTDKIMDKI